MVYQNLKNWADVVLYHMLASKRKNLTLPYSKLVTKIISYTNYEFKEEEPVFVHTNIRQSVIRKWDMIFKKGNLFLKRQEEQDSEAIATILHPPQDPPLTFEMIKEK